MIRVGIIDYGLGNLASVAGAVTRLGHTPVVSSDARELAGCERLILPGVGAFGRGMANLRARNLVEPLAELVLGRSRPILGICLGFQLMAGSSTEFGNHEGLGWISGRVVRISPDAAKPSLRVPHVGWETLARPRPDALFEGVPEDAHFYWVHSFHLVPDDPAIVTGTCDYGGLIVGAFAQGAVRGVQFHPEKSQRHGLTVLRNFLEGA